MLGSFFIKIQVLHTINLLYMAFKELKILLISVSGGLVPWGER